MVALGLLGCDNNNTDGEKANTIDTPVAAQPSGSPTHNWAGCYRAVQGQDTILLQLTGSDSTISGTMQYDNYGIDGNIGTLQATVRNNRLQGYFRFFSEGMWSVREVIFEKRQNQLLQADTRQMTSSGDTVVFSNPQLLNWDTQRPFVPVNCSELEFDAVPQ